MDRNEFEQQGRSLAWSPEVSSMMAGALSVLQMSLAEDGVRAQAERVGSMVHILAGHGHYRGCLVDDPELGVYAVHLELVVDWDSVTLDLIAYKSEFNAREASQLLRPYLVKHRVGVLAASAWRVGPVHEVRERLVDWLKEMFGNGPAGMVPHTRLLRDRLGEVLEPLESMKTSFGGR